jgi:hypothetical protein
MDWETLDLTITAAANPITELNMQPQTAGLRNVMCLLCFLLDKTWISRIYQQS